MKIKNSRLLLPLAITLGAHASFTDHSAEIVASVRLDNSLSCKEINTLKLRLDKEQVALKNFTDLDIPLNQMPRTGVVGSGGGVRSAIAMLGLLQGIETIGLLDAVNYMSTMSGSTWSPASWLVHGMTLAQTTDYLRTQLANIDSIKQMYTKDILKTLRDKIESGHLISLNDIYGAILAQIFFAKNTGSGQDTYLSQIEQAASSGLYPIPIFEAAIGETSPSYQRAEFTPFEIGSTFLNAWIAPSALGKTFNKGLTTDTTKEERFGYVLGLLGSAYAGNFSDTVNLIIDTLEDELNITIYNAFLSWLPWGNGLRLSAPEVPNFSYNLSSNPLDNTSSLTFVDAGVDIDFSFHPLFRREINLYFVCDATSDSSSPAGNDLNKIATYAHANQIPFPVIDFDQLVKETVSIWYDKNDPTVPVIVYVPNFQAFSTFKFDYAPEEFDAVFCGIENAVIQNADLFKQAITIAISNMQQLTN